MKYLFFVSLLLFLVFPQQMKAQDIINLSLLEKPELTFEIENLSKLYVKENGVINASLDIELLEENFVNYAGKRVVGAQILKFQVSKSELGYKFISFFDVDKLSEKERIKLTGRVEPVIISIDLGGDYEVIPAAFISGRF